MGKSVCTPRSDSKATGSKEAIGSGVKGTKSSWRNELMIYNGRIVQNQFLQNRSN